MIVYILGTGDFRVLSFDREQSDPHTYQIHTGNVVDINRIKSTANGQVHGICRVMDCSWHLSKQYINNESLDSFSQRLLSPRIHDNPRLSYQSNSYGGIRGTSPDVTYKILESAILR